MPKGVQLELCPCTAAPVGSEGCEEPTLGSASPLAGARLTNRDHGDKSGQVRVPAPALPSYNRHRSSKVLQGTLSQCCHMLWAGTPKP